MPSKGRRGTAGGSKQPLVGVSLDLGGVPGPQEGGMGEADWGETFGLSWQPEARGLCLMPFLGS